MKQYNARRKPAPPKELEMTYNEAVNEIPGKEQVEWEQSDNKDLISGGDADGTDRKPTG